MKKDFLESMRHSLIGLLATALVAMGMAVPGVARAAHAAQPAAAPDLWLGEFFNNATLSGNPVLRRYTRSIAFNWGVGTPSRAISRDNFSVRWTRTLNVAPGVYRFRAVADDGVRVFVDNTAVIDAWQDGSARTSEADVSLTGRHVIRVEYYERANTASVAFTITPVAAAQPNASWRAEFFNNTELTGSPVAVRNDAQINFNWGSGSPAPGVNADGFSTRWTRQLSNLAAGYYSLVVRVDDGVRVYVDGNLVINEWRDGAPRDVGANVFLSNASSLRVEYYDRTGGALIQVSIFPTSGAQPAPTSAPAPVVSFPDWRAEYFSNPNLSGSPVLVRNDASINFDWGYGSPDASVPAENFSARWTGVPKLTPGNYRLKVRVDDGVRIYINGQIVLNLWADGPARDASVDFSVGATPPEVRVEYYDRLGGAVMQLSFVALATTSFTDWKAEYFNNADLSGTPAVIRNDTGINFDWGTGSPDGRIMGDNFSARWSRRQNFAGGTYRIEANMDDGMRVYVDGNLVIDEWRDAAARTRTADVTLSAGDHDLRVDYYERAYSAVAKFSITRVDQAPTATPIPTLTPIP